MEALLDVALAIEAAAPVPAAVPQPAAPEPPPAAAAAPPAAAVAAIAAAAAPIMAAMVVAAAGPAVAAIVVDEIVGCKLDVWRGTATRTKGGLMRQHLKLNRIGTVVSIKASNAAKQNRNLGNYQFPINP
jgi:hypothetical protein